MKHQLQKRDQNGESPMGPELLILPRQLRQPQPQQTLCINFLSPGHQQQPSGCREGKEKAPFCNRCDKTHQNDDQRWNKEAKETAERLRRCLKRLARETIEGGRPRYRCFRGKAEPGILAVGTSRSGLDSTMDAKGSEETAEPQNPAGVCSLYPPPGRRLSSAGARRDTFADMTKKTERRLYSSGRSIIVRLLPRLEVFQSTLSASSSGRATAGAVPRRAQSSIHGRAVNRCSPGPSPSRPASGWM